LSSDSFKTIFSPITNETKEKGSRFICQVHPADTVDDAEAKIAAIAKTYFDATHNCYAYRLGFDEHRVTRFNDDGEPSGTAGKPILQAIEGRDLTNIVVVVTRYFGGTKLGTGGLIRAYGGAASIALDQTNVKKVFIEKTLELICPYHFLNTIMSLLEKSKGHVVSSDYGENVHLMLRVRQSQCDLFVAQIIDKTAGQVVPELVS
jgi:uncharacterized YigZ family protein